MSLNNIIKGTGPDYQDYNLLTKSDIRALISKIEIARIICANFANDDTQLVCSTAKDYACQKIKEAILVVPEVIGLLEQEDMDFLGC